MFWNYVDGIKGLESFLSLICISKFEIFIIYFRLVLMFL